MRLLGRIAVILLLALGVVGLTVALVEGGGLGGLLSGARAERDQAAGDQLLLGGDDFDGGRMDRGGRGDHGQGGPAALVEVARNLIAVGLIVAGVSLVNKAAGRLKRQRRPGGRKEPRAEEPSGESYV